VLGLRMSLPTLQKFVLRFENRTAQGIVPAALALRNLAWVAIIFLDQRASLSRRFDPLAVRQVLQPHRTREKVRSP
jgi:hypothetical protein